MSNLKEYIEQVKEFQRNNPDLTETELIRYVYLDLGKRFSFDLNYAFGTKATKKKIYNKTEKADLEASMENNTIICISACHILEYVLGNLGINIRTKEEERDVSKFPHVYNIITQKNGKEYIIDLQSDIKNIQSHSFTSYYGLSVERGKPAVISRAEIERMDRKLGYIDDKNYYADDYMYLLKSYIEVMGNVEDKAELVLENIDIYQNREMNYHARKWHHEELLKKLFSIKEMRKIHMIDCYEQIGDEREYRNCIAVDNKTGTDIYMYDIEKNKYCKMTIEDFARLIREGLVNLQPIRGLKYALNKIDKKDEIGR